MSALVTGASSGLGRATAAALAAEGVAVVAVDLAEAGERRPGVVPVRADVCDQDDVSRAIECATGMAPLKIVVNCAGGGGRPGRLVDGDGRPMDRDDFMAKIELNLWGTVNVTRLAAAAMVNGAIGDEERGVIVQTSSIAAFEGQVGQSAYAAAKGAVGAAVLPWARELARDRIRVVAIAPGVFDTPRLANFSEEVRSGLTRDVPHPTRMGHPGEFASLVVEVVRNPMINGTTIRLDGALRMASTHA